MPPEALSVYDVWTQIREPTESDEYWVGEIWLTDQTNNDSHLFETIVDKDESMFRHWFQHHINALTQCIAEEDSCDLWFCYENTLSQ